MLSHNRPLQFFSVCKQCKPNIYSFSIAITFEVIQKSLFESLLCSRYTVGTLMNRMCIFSCKKTMGCECGYTGCMGFPGGSDSKESSYNVGDLRLDPWVGKIPWRREWKPSLVFLPGEWTEEPGGLQSMGSQRARHN